jgi:hypothetical protein
MRRRSGRTGILDAFVARLLALGLLATALPAFAQGPTATPQSAPLPGQLSAAIQAAIGTGTGATVVIGSTTLDLWWATPAAATWDGVPEGALVGALRVAGAFREIRGKVVKPGVYTLRYGLQPQNGDHLGAAPNREFLLVSPAAIDTDPKALGFDGTVALAKETIGTSHPAALSIDPPTASDAPLSTYSTDPDLRGVVFQVGKLRFGLILSGRIEH